MWFCEWRWLKWVFIRKMKPQGNGINRTLLCHLWNIDIILIEEGEDRPHKAF